MSTNRGWVIVDVETTGTDFRTDRILSVAALAMASDGTIVDTMATPLNPGVDPGPTHIHGLTDADLAGAPQFHQVIAELAAMVRGRTLVAQNVDFDYGFLAAEARRGAIELPVASLLCTVEVAQHLKLGLANLKLATLASHYRVAQLRPHDALADASVLARIFRQMLADASRAAMPLPIRPASVPAARLSA